MKYFYFLPALILFFGLSAQAQFVGGNQLQINTEIPEVSGEEIILQGQVTNFVFDQQETLLSLSTSNGLWQFSAPSAVELRRLGWTSDSLFIGEQVQIAALRQLGLGNKGTLKRVTRANGAFLFASLNNDEQTASFENLKKGMYSLNRDYSQLYLNLNYQNFSQVGIQFEQVSSDILWNKDIPETSIIQIDIDTASLSSGIPSIDTKLKNQQFFNPINYPKIRFRSTSITFLKWGDAEIEGQLEINNRVQSVTLNASLSKISADSQTGQHRMGVKLKGGLMLSKWGFPEQSDLTSNTAELVLNAVYILRETSANLSR